MTAVDTTTGEIVETLTADEARALTDELRQTLRVGHDLLIRAFHGRAWSVLGYESWDAYCAGEFAEARMVGTRVVTDSSCRECAGLYRVIRSEVRKNENRHRRGEPVDLTVIEQAKADIAECGQRGHAGPVWQRELAAQQT